MSSVLPSAVTPQAVMDELREFDASLDLLDQAAAEALGIKRTDLRAMELVSRQGTVSAGTLAEQLHLTTGAVTGLIDRMEQMGYFRRTTHPADRRKVIVELTPRARVAERRIFERVGKAWGQRLSSYSPEQLALLFDFVRQGRALMDEVIRQVASAKRRRGEDRRRRPQPGGSDRLAPASTTRTAEPRKRPRRRSSSAVLPSSSG